MIYGKNEVNGGFEKQAMFEDIGGWKWSGFIGQGDTPGTSCYPALQCVSHPNHWRSSIHAPSIRLSYVGFDMYPSPLGQNMTRQASLVGIKE